MKRQDFSFDLPEALIAQYPLASRSDSRLLRLSGKTGEISHNTFKQLADFLRAGDCLIFNDTKVIPARLYGRKSSGGRLEILVERILSPSRVLAHIRASKAPKPGSQIELDNDLSAMVIGRAEALFELEFSGEQSVLDILDAIGHIPLPPYIDRQDEQNDIERYQTVYAQNPGAVAAPTAGLHFDEALLATLKAKGIEQGFVTLHVGAGTFQPVRVDDIQQHTMHSEYIEVSEQVCTLIEKTQQKGGRVIAVGTTSVRCLETAAQQGKIAPFYGDTDIFIYPGYSFHVVDAMITNFHLPESTLLMLMCAFAGYESMMTAYQQAVAHAYRFFSYGDAMFVTRKTR